MIYKNKEHDFSSFLQTGQWYNVRLVGESHLNSPNTEEL
jgi:hypothetical protein